MKNNLTLQIEFLKPHCEGNVSSEGDIFEVFQVYQDDYELYLNTLEDSFLPSGTLPFS